MTTHMRVKNKEDILKILNETRPADFDCVTIKLGGKNKKVIGRFSRHPSDEICGCLFDASLHRRITSVSLSHGLGEYRHLIFGTSECRDHTTNIDADVIESVCDLWNRNEIEWERIESMSLEELFDYCFKDSESVVLSLMLLQGRMG